MVDGTAVRGRPEEMNCGHPKSGRAGSAAVPKGGAVGKAQLGGWADLEDRHLRRRVLHGHPVCRQQASGEWESVGGGAERRVVGQSGRGSPRGVPATHPGAASGTSRHAPGRTSPGRPGGRTQSGRAAPVATRVRRTPNDHARRPAGRPRTFSARVSGLLMRLRMICRRANRVRRGGPRAPAPLAARHLDFVRHGVVVHKRVRLQPAHGHRADGRCLEQRARHAVAQGLVGKKGSQRLRRGSPRAQAGVHAPCPDAARAAPLCGATSPPGGLPSAERRRGCRLKALSPPPARTGCRCPQPLLRSAWLSPPRCGQPCLWPQGLPCFPNAARTSATGWCPSPTRCWPSSWRPQPWTGLTRWRRWGRQTQQPRRVVSVCSSALVAMCDSPTPTCLTCRLGAWR